MRDSNPSEYDGVKRRRVSVRGGVSTDLFIRLGDRTLLVHEETARSMRDQIDAALKP